ncbi:SLC13 family permease [Natronorarus salvus]|uniref:SLC13 family permease n=1 Tax=Natronorarus salvus TaxID=3117733 RepID=UPI002F263765
MSIFLILQTTGELPPLTTEILVVFGIIAVALVLFVTEPIPIDVTAVAILVTLIVLEPWTQISPSDGVSGFSSSATITVLAMFILSDGIRRTGLISILGSKIAEQFGDSPLKQLAAVVGLSGGTAGFINNTPVVALMIPMVNDISQRTGVSPSKFLIPVSFASMLGGMLTLIGTSTNILASDVSARLIDRPFTMFEFTQLGFLVLVTGCLYILLIGRHLIPERVHVEEQLTEEFEMANYLTEVVVREGSPLAGMTVHECLEELELEADIVQLVRDDQTFTEPLAQKTVQPDDILVIRTGRESLVGLLNVEGLALAPDADVTDDHLEVRLDRRDERGTQRLVEVIITPDTNIIGETLETLNFRHRYDATVLAIRRGGEIIHARMDDRPLRPGDTLLLQATDQTVNRLNADRSFVVAQEVTRPDFRSSKIPIALGIIVGVIGLAAFEVFPIMVTALGGMVAMVATGCVRPTEVYDSVDWNVIFLLAGLIPLGIAMEQTGAAAWLASVIVIASAGLSAVLVLGLFYLATALITELISNNASVVLMIPVAVDAAIQIDANVFAFVLAVTFGASTSMLSPIGYQTNLMVYGPGGYKFTDFFRVGAPLQLILTVVTTAGIVIFWGV